MTTKHLNLFRRLKQSNSVFGEDKQEQVPVSPHGTLHFDADGNAEMWAALTAFTRFVLPPNTSAAYAAAKDNEFYVAGDATPVVAVSAAKGGINMKTKTSASAGEDAYLVPQAASLAIVVLSVTAKPVFATRVSLASIAGVLASAGLDEGGTDANPAATAGDGVRFVFDPEEHITTAVTGLTSAQHANWILHQKVDGTDYWAATNLPVAAGVDYDLKIEIGADLKPKFFINGVEYTAPVDSDGNALALTAGDTVKGGVLVETRASAQKSIDIRYVRVSKELGG